MRLAADTDSIREAGSHLRTTPARWDIWRLKSATAWRKWSSHGCGDGRVHLTVRGIGIGPSDLRHARIIESMVVPMVGLMRIERHSWRMATEMSVGMAAPMVVCLALVRLGICPLIPLLTWLSAANVYAVAHDAMLLGCWRSWSTGMGCTHLRRW